MEAVPKLPMLSFNLKTSPENTNFAPKLKQYILEAYREEPDNYGEEIYQLESLRAIAVRPTVNAEGLQSLYQYFFQLRAMQSRFPMGKGQPISINFSWRDLYANMTCALADSKFEMASILYNIGAMHTKLGAEEPRTSPDSLKAACIHFQNAAWAFQHLTEEYAQPAGVDVAEEIMRLFQEICFAQAQECILEKSILDTKKASVIGAVANQVVQFYKNSLAILGPSAGSDNIHETVGTKRYNAWHRYLSFKVAYIGCVVYLYQGINAEEQQKMGERLAYYQQALEKLNEARKLAKHIEPVQVTTEALTFTNDVVEGKRKAAKNENEFVYHEEVPEKDLLAEPKPVCLVKALPINFNDPSVGGKDLFAKLIPMGAHEASSLYSEEKAKLLRQVVAQVETKNTELLEFMSSLQLDQLDVIDSEQKIPQEIVDRCAAMNARSDIIQLLVDSMNNLAEIISDVEHSLADCKNIIQEETAKEKEYQKIMGDRPPSLVQTELSREYNKYQEAHLRTNESNQVLHKAMTLHIANLKILAQPLNQLEAKIPTIDNIEGLDRATMTEMRRVVGKAREMQTQREELVQALREAVNADDVTGALLSRNQSPQEIFKQEIEKHAPKIQIIEKNLAAQENIINALTSLYASYGESRRLLSEVLRKREGLINALVTSFDAYEELLGKSQKGLEFYRKLNNNVSQLLTRLKSTCQVQAEERAQMLAKQADRATTATPPAASSISKRAEIPPISVSDGKPKLKDYLPYMRNRVSPSPAPAQVIQPEIVNDSYYPDTIYPSTVRPAPVGSEADPTQMKYPDGYTSQSPAPYIPYMNTYDTSENNPYANPNSYAYANAGKSMNYDVNKVDNDVNYGYNTPYTPAFSSLPTTAMSPQNYNPYYSASQDPNQYNPNVNQPNMNPNAGQYSLYNQSTVTGSHGYQMDTIPEVSSAYSNPKDLNVSFAQMHVTAKPEPDYVHPNVQNSMAHQGMYSNNTPQANTVNMSTYSNALDNRNTHSVPAQTPDLSLNYPYSPGVNQPIPQSMPQSMPQSIPQSMPQSMPQSIPQSVSQSIPDQSFMQNIPNPSSSNIAPTGYNTNQGYPIYSNTDVISTDNLQAVPINVMDPYSLPEEAKATLAKLDALDKPIKSHATGEALSSNIYQTSYPTTYGVNYTSTSAQVDQNIQPNQSVVSNQTDPNQINTYQNHPGYGYSNVSGTYEYNYGSQNSQNSYVMNQGSVDSNAMGQSLNLPNQLYTSAGGCNTVQSPSEQPQAQINDQNQIYYNTPYGYQTMQTNDVGHSSQSTSTNYGANVNLSTYMQSNQPDTSVTYSNNQVIPPNENMTSPVIDPQNPSSQLNQYQDLSGNFQQVPNNYQSLPNNYQSLPSNYQQVPSISQQSSGNFHQVPGDLQQANSNSQLPTNNYHQVPSQHITNSFQQVPTNLQQVPSEYNPVIISSQQSTSNLQQVPSITQNVGTNDYQHVPNNYQQVPENQNVPENVQTVENNSLNYQRVPDQNVANYQQNYVLQASQSDTGNVQNQIVNSSEPNNYQSTPSNMSSQSVNYQNTTDNSQIVPQSYQTVTNTYENPTYQNTSQIQSNQVSTTSTSNQSVIKQEKEEIKEVKREQKEPELPTSFDLLSDIDFTVEYKPLMPEIKVPQVSESCIVKKPVYETAQVLQPQRSKEEVIERPAKRDLFSDAGLLNKFTEEVKGLQKLVDSFTNVTHGGVTLLDSKWKMLQDVQQKENMHRSKSVAKQNCGGNILTEVSPFDDSRIILKSNPDAYLNATYYKQLAPWCIPLVISKSPEGNEVSTFWTAVLENKIVCIACLVTEIEMQGNIYWPTSKGYSNEFNNGVKITLDEVNCTVNWIERTLTVTDGKSVVNVTHYQINVFPSKIVCGPLVLLVDKILNQTFDNRLSNQLSPALIHCKTGAGRSSVLALLTMIMCQVRAGQLSLCATLETGCINLCKHRSNVLEDTKYLADAYRTALFYVQGVLCSGTTMFNGEAIKSQSGASIPPPINTSNVSLKDSKIQKFTKESFEEMRHSPQSSSDMKDPLNFLDPLWSLKKK